MGTDYARHRAEMVMKMAMAGRLPDLHELDQMVHQAWAEKRKGQKPPENASDVLRMAQEHAIPPELALAINEHEGGFQGPDAAYEAMHKLADARSLKPDLVNDPGGWAAQALGNSDHAYADSINAHHTAFKGLEIPPMEGGSEGGEGPQSDEMLSMPSPIPGLLMGQYHDLRSLADKESMRALGHPATAAMVQELFQQGINSPQDVRQYFEQLASELDIDPGIYQQIVKANLPIMQAIFNEYGFDPRIAQQQMQLAQGNGFEIPQQQQVTAPQEDPGQQQPVTAQAPGGTQPMPGGPDQRNGQS